MAKTVLITGATGKIGLQLLKHFSQKGFIVLFTSRNEKKIQELTAEYENVIGIKLDLYDKECAQNVVAEIKRLNLDVNYLVNNARDLNALHLNDDGSILRENWLKEYTIDVVAPYEISLALSKACSLKKIINISSVYGMVSFNLSLYEGNTNFVLQYACAKAALIQLTKCLAVQLAENKIAVNCISYGGVEGRVDADFLERYARLCPQGRMMHDEETVGAVDFLLSESSAYITGQNIVVDGGWTAW